jgi:hypothetical protein
VHYVTERETFYGHYAQSLVFMPLCALRNKEKRGFLSPQKPNGFFENRMIFLKSEKTL